MARCDCCHNTYDKAFKVTLHDGSEHHFDSFQCAIHMLAPACPHCGCKVIGNGAESDGVVYCCAHCARMDGVSGVDDRAD